MVARLLSTAALLWAAAASLVWADTTFRHPILGFTILVPDGWNTDNQDSGVNVGKSPAYVSVFVANGTGSPIGLLEKFVEPIKNQWQAFDEVRRGNCNLAGLDGYCRWFTGVDRRGVEVSVKVAAAGRDGKGYVLVVVTPRQNADTFVRDLNRIEQSVSLGIGVAPGAPAVSGAAQSSNRDQLAALDKAYQEGKLSTDEYETKKRALSGAPAPANPPPPSRPAARETPVPTPLPTRQEAPSEQAPARDRPAALARIPYGARVFIAAMENGLDGYVAAEILKIRMPIVIVTDEKEADYVLTGSSSKADDKWYHTVFGGKDRNEGNVKMLSVKEKQLVWAAEAGDRSLWWGSLKRGGQRKVAERIVKQMSKDLFKK